MTLGELVDRYRPHLTDESVGVRRSWEDMFKYTLKLYSTDTSLEAFDMDELASKLVSAGLHRPIVDGYVNRWRALVRQADEL